MFGKLVEIFVMACSIDGCLNSSYLKTIKYTKSLVSELFLTSLEISLRLQSAVCGVNLMVKKLLDVVGGKQVLAIH